MKVPQMIILDGIERFLSRLKSLLNNHAIILDGIERPGCDSTVCLSSRYDNP